MLSDSDLERYSRQILLPGFDIAGQERLRNSTVLILGLGGLGSPAALYLAAAGVGCLRLADGDAVELSNLQRQFIHREADLGRNKAESAAAAIAERNPAVVVDLLARRLDEAALEEAMQGVDVVLDCSDNYPIRYALNRVCLKHGIPLISAAAVRSEGQLAVFDPRSGGACYRCLYPEAGAESALSCSQSGVLGPVVGVLGSLQALEAIKLLSAYGQVLRAELLLMDLATLDIQRVGLSARPACPDCSAYR